MRKYLVRLLLIFAVVLVGCAGAPEPVEETDAVSAATPEGSGWNISLIGVRSDDIYQSQFEAWKAEDGVSVEMELEKKGETNLYGGILLKDIVAMVDDPSGGMPFEFRENLWTDGYDITLVAADGYSFTFNTAEAPSGEVLLVDTIDGETVSPRIAGNVTGKAWVRDLVEIELSLAPVDLAQNSFEFEMEINGEQSSYTIAEMEAMDIYVEDKGSFTNSHGNTTNSVYGGVRLIPLLTEYMEVTSDTAIRVIAMDGYEMNYGGDMLLDQVDGDWILAFKENGEYMPEDPGYIRLVKVGPDNPNISGHASARMIKKIITEGEPFQDFELVVVSEFGTEVFDRQTMQSGVVTNRNRVSYNDRKADADIPYMGIALWRLIERMEGYKQIVLTASDGFSITLENSQVEGNDDVIIAMYTGEDDQLLSADEWPLKIVWDKDAAVVPDGIKAVRNISRIELIY